MTKQRAILFTLILNLVFLTLSTFGQNVNKTNILIKLHPSAIVALSRPTVLGSIEFKYKRTGFDFAYGQQWLFIGSTNPDTVRVKNFGNQYRIDLKYYLNPLKRYEQTTPFISIGYCKMYTQKNIAVDWFSGYQFKPGLATINNIHVYYINYGISSKFGRIVYEFALSGGVRFRTEESVYANKVVYDKATRIWPHLSFSFRICYPLFKDKVI